MNGKIDKEGYLYIERGGMMKRQGCFFHTATATAIMNYVCGDGCSQFGEPVQPPPHMQPAASPKMLLDICQGRTLVFEKFEDERGAK